ncbi:MAG TPA: alpha/beta fold hydrolase [Gemmataceae bacterium]|nr:alpha/beta fold hydrolase [Gemmataceae bacterium]
MSPRQHDAISLPVPAGGTLRGHLSYHHKPGRWAVLYVHGFGSVRGGEKAVALEAACARRGYTFAAFDFRGHGESSGTMLDLRCSALLHDLQAIAEYLEGRGIGRLCPVGSSMGGWASAWFGLRQPQRIGACVLVSPALTFPSSIWGRLNEADRRAWKQTGRLRVRTEWVDTEIGTGLAEEVNEYALDQLIKGWRWPLLIIHGMQDDVVPYRLSVDLAERATYLDIELRLYKNGDHRLLAFKDEMAEAAGEFFARWVSAPFL